MGVVSQYSRSRYAGNGSVAGRIPKRLPNSQARRLRKRLSRRTEPLDDGRPFEGGYPMFGASFLKAMSARLAPVVAVGLIACGGAQAQQYPNQDIHLISAFPPGSGADVLVRYVAEKLRPIAGRNVLVENKPGAGGNI